MKIYEMLFNLCAVLSHLILLLLIITGIVIFNILIFQTDLLILKILVGYIDIIVMLGVLSLMLYIIELER